MKSNLILIGFMGSGKSTVGKLLAKSLEMNFFDTDLEIEKEQNLAIKDIFTNYGEAYFRDLEKKMSIKLSKVSNAVISTGGGIILNDENIKNLKYDGVVFFLDVNRRTLYNRLINDTDRPLLSGDELWAKINSVLDSRIDKYRSSSDFIIKVKDEIPYETTEDIKRIYIERG